MEKLAAAADKAYAADPNAVGSNANLKMLAAIEKLVFEDIPSDPGRPEYRQGNTLGPENRHWFRAKFYQRFRLFFRYDSQAKIIVYAWVNDAKTLRKAGSKSDPYAVFVARLKAGDPPGDWRELVKASHGAVKSSTGTQKSKKT